MVTRHVPVSQSPRPAVRPSAVVGSCFSSGRSSPSASLQACCCINRCLCHGLGSHVQWACSCGALDRAPTAVACQCLELLAVWLALRRFKTLLHDKHVLVRTDNTATVAYINHQGGLRSRRMSQLARHLLLWSQKHICVAESDGLRKYAFPPVSLLAQTLCKVREDEEQVSGGAVLAQLDLVPRTDAPRDSPSLANSSEEGSPFSERGHPLAPASRLVESPCMVPGWDAEVLGGLPPSVVNTITSARAPSTRHAYRLKWNLFVGWCSSHREDPRRCPIAVVLSFLQDGLERRLSPSTLKVYVAAIAAHHDAVDGKSVGKHDLVVRFLRGARRLNPPRPHLVPSWDLPSVLTALKEEPFEPLQSVELKFLSLKTVLLTALASAKRVGGLQAFSDDDSCLEFGPADSHVVLRLWAWICAQSSHHAL